ncbi:MAG: ABC transporter substrate-binding protein [Planctomycetes bacterium]|nr:ABC transporter substrate-binding protein [Planctomycetota bacterium]
MRVTFLFLLAAITIAFAGCERPTQPAATGGPAAPASLPELRLGYFANLTHAQAVLGAASGDFEKAVAPAKLTTRIFNAGPSLIEALFAGELDIGYVGPGPAINACEKSHGTGVRIIAGAAANGVGVVARRDAGIKTLQDLRGKRIATPQLGNTQDISARHYLTSQLGEKNISNVLPIPNAEQLALLQRGEIDAAWAPEPWASRLILEAGGVLVAEEKDLWEGGRFTLALIVASPEFLAKHPDTIRRVLEVHKKWTKRLRTEPKACVSPLSEALNELTGKKIPAEAFSQAVARTEFTNEPLEATLNKFAEWSYDLGFSKSRPDLTGLVDTSVLRSIPD